MRLIRHFLSLLVLSSCSLHAQYVFGKAVFLNLGAYPQADLLALTGLKPGDPLNKTDLQAAAQRLIDTGYFDDVQATIGGSVKSLEARFKLTPIDPAKLIPVTYENFVWLSPDELKAFQKSVPLLTLGVPEAGTQQDAVQTALQKLLAAKAITAMISHTLIEPSTGHPRRMMEYRVDSPRVQLGKASLSGVSAQFTDAMAAALKQAQETEYNEGEAGISTTEMLLTPLFDAGYLDAKLDEVRRSVMTGGTSPTTLVEVNATVVSGDPYRVSVVDFSGTEVESSAAFNKTARLHAGEIASLRDLRTTLNAVRNAYHTGGYMDAVVDATVAKDAATHQVTFGITVVPGQQYRLRSIIVKGLSAGAKADFDRAFALKSGELYDEDYVGTFLIHNGDIRSLSNYAGTFKASADPNTHLLDLTVDFRPGNSITVR